MSLLKHHYTCNTIIRLNVSSIFSVRNVSLLMVVVSGSWTDISINVLHNISMCQSTIFKPDCMFGTIKKTTRMSGISIESLDDDNCQYWSVINGCSDL